MPGRSLPIDEVRARVVLGFRRSSEVPVACLTRRARPARFRSGSGERAFSLVETLVACALVSILASLSVGVYVSALKAARIARAIGDLRAMDVDVRAFHTRFNRYPTTLAEVGRPVPIDPWGTPYVYTDLSQPGSRGRARKDGRLNPINSDFDLYSLGEDRRTSTPLTAPMSKDDVIRARDGAFLGLAQDF
jgi:general secretion pathway protein G